MLDPPLPPADAPPVAATSTPPPEAPDASGEPTIETAEEAAERERSEQAILNSLSKMQAAEQQQAERQRMSQAEAALAKAFPELTTPQRWFLMKHPDYLDPALTPVVQAAFSRGLNRIKLRYDSPELFTFIEDEVRQHKDVLASAERLDKDVQRERMTSAAQGTPLVEPPGAEPEVVRREPAIPAPVRSMPRAAPPSRNEVPTMSGRPRSNDNRLTEEERKVARESFVDRPEWQHLTDTQREYMYLQNKKKYEQMKRDGTYTDERRR